MPKEFYTEAQVEEEIERLSKSEFVKLARRELRLKYKRRQRMYQLRSLEKRGRQLDAEGVTLENLEAMLAEMEAEENET